MKGKYVGIGLIGTAALAGAALYYLQVFHFYSRLDPDAVEIRLIAAASDTPEPIAVENLRAIDAGSSPIRFRACFDTPLQPADLGAYTAYDGAEPLTAPGWFDCFDAAAIAAALQDGSASAFVSEREVSIGVDRVVAVFEDGRGYAWHQLRPGFED